MHECKKSRYSLFRSVVLILCVLKVFSLAWVEVMQFVFAVFLSMGKKRLHVRLDYICFPYIEKMLAHNDIYQKYVIRDYCFTMFAV